jgi:hypothetical protein
VSSPDEPIHGEVLVHGWPVKTITGRGCLDLLPVGLRRVSEAWGMLGKVDAVGFAVDIEM